jgi:hypothetical protein
MPKLAPVKNPHPKNFAPLPAISELCFPTTIIFSSYYQKPPEIGKNLL